MALRRQLDDEEFDLLEVLEDPVWFGEFLRNTADGSPNEEEWPRGEPFAYRWYQRDLMTDKSEFISLVAGRAVGKCSPLTARVYTYPEGYRYMKDLVQSSNAGEVNIVYALDRNKQLVQRRASVHNNGWKPVIRIETEAGHIFDGTENHPILTPKGYIELKDLTIGDDVAVLTALPHDSEQNAFTWEELRWMGYAFGGKYIRPEAPIKVRFQKQLLELQEIAKFFDAKLTQQTDGTYRLLRKRGVLKHYVSYLCNELHLNAARSFGIVRIPVMVKRERLGNIKIMLESYFSTYATFTASSVTVNVHYKTLAYDIQELLLRFGVESRVTRHDEENFEVSLLDYRAYYTFFETFDIPGVSVRGLKPVLLKDDAIPFLRFEPIVRYELLGNKPTFGLSVHEDHNYISDNLLVHNSIVLEDAIIYEGVNADKVFPMKREEVLVTANKTQMDPIFDRIVMRYMNSMLLKDFLGGQVNRSKGTLDFTSPGGANFRFYARIAGPKGEQNMVGLHQPRIKGDEMQIFPMAAYIQLGPTYDSWDPGRQQFFCGVPNGRREGNVLYYIDQRSKKFKKYRVPAHANPYFTYRDNMEALNQYGGEDSEDYKHLVLGQHGEAAYSIIPRDKIRSEPIDSFEFSSYRYNQTDRHNGKSYKQTLGLVHLKPSKSVVRVLSLDTGFADPTLAHVICKGNDGIWRTIARYRLTRIPFPEQAEIVNWLDDHYGFHSISIDLGAGGNGIGLMQDLQSERFPRSKKYDKRIVGVRFADFLVTGEDSDGNALKTRAKSFAGQELARMITDGHMVFSELDMEGMNHLERVVYNRRADGTNEYFVQSESGVGKSKDDHIFASYVVFVLGLLDSAFDKPRPKLFGATWLKP